MIEIKELHNWDTITESLNSVGGSLFDQKVNQPEVLRILEKKYAESANIVIATSNSKLVGLCAYYDNNCQSAYISMIVIIEECQHRGYGTKLLRKVIWQCRQKEIRGLRLEVSRKNRKAIDFYMKNGSQRIKTT